MNAITLIPLEGRLALLFILGAWLGGQINRAIYRLAWNARPIGPWSLPHPEASPRHWVDRIPVLGWLGLRRESSIHGTAFWVRPLLLELATGIGLAALYLWEVNGGLFPRRAAILGPSLTTIHLQFFSHSVLIALMTAATFIDFDEKTIPDEITIPGVLIGLTLAALAPTSLLPVVERSPGIAGPLMVAPIHVASPLFWPDWLNSALGLLAGYACYLGWCLALLPRVWITRRGFKRAFIYLWAATARYANWRILSAIFIFGWLGITATWWVGDLYWRSLYTALIGMAFGGLMIWSVRIVGSGALGQEAMGFGDVTLMAMIGTFIGWQASLMTFFLAPFAALIISVMQWILTRRKDIAFGPYLCLGALILIVYWKPIWNDFAGPTFALGWMIIIMMAICLVLMFAMLFIWVQIRDRLFVEA